MHVYTWYHPQKTFIHSLKNGAGLFSTVVGLFSINFLLSLQIYKIQECIIFFDEKLLPDILEKRKHQVIFISVT